MTCTFCHKEVQNPHVVKADGQVIYCCSDDIGCQDDFADYLDFGACRIESVKNANLSPATRFPPDSDVS